MPGDTLDIKKIRRNWELASRADDSRTGGKLASVRPPLDPYAAARADLARLREILRAEFAEHDATLRPFLARIEAAIERLAALAEPDGAAKLAAEGAEEVDPKALRAELEDALFDTEDLLEVFSMPLR